MDDEASINEMHDLAATKPGRRVLIVDDEASICEVLGRYLTLDGFIVQQASDGSEALRLAASQPPDLIILDVMLPGIDGLEICRQLRATSMVPVLLLTARTAEEDKIAGFRFGADDYVTKPFSPREVVMRVQAIMRRAERATMPPADDVLRSGPLVMQPKLRLAQYDTTLLDLTVKEFDLLYFLATQPRQVFTRQQLLDHLWGYDYYGDASAVTVHIHRLREKVERDPAHPQHIKTVWGVGYKYDP